MARNLTEVPLPKRSTVGDLGLKALLLAAAAYGALSAYQFSHFTWKRSSDSEAIYATNPDDPQAMAKHMWAAISSDPSYQPDKTDVAHARASLAKTPLWTPSLWIISISAEMSGDIAGADAAMSLADRISRRDILTQMWLIERSVEKDDMKEAVRHYDAALSVNDGLEATLLPILSQAISFPEVRAALAPYLARRARWVPALLKLAATNSAIGDFLELVDPLGSELQSDEFAVANSIMIQRIAREQGGFEAFDYAAKAVPDFDLEVFALPGFTPLTTDTRFASLAWSLTHSGGINTRLGDDSGLIVELQPDVSGKVALRDFPVEPGATYLFSQLVRDTGPVKGQSVKWLAQCGLAGNAITIGQFAIPWPEGSRTLEARISVPDDCSLLRLRLTAQGPQSQLPASFEISNLRLRRF